MKKTIFTIIITTIIVSTVSIYATYNYLAQDVEYSNSKNTNVHNVQEAIDDLYDTTYYRYNESNKYIEVKDTNGDWISIYKTDSVPLSDYDASLISISPVISSKINSTNISENTSNIKAENAFDGVTTHTSSAYGAIVSDGSYSSSLGYNFDNKVKVKKVILYLFNGKSSQVIDAYLQYSDDGITWNNGSNKTQISSNGNVKQTEIISTEINVAHCYWRIYISSSEALHISGNYSTHWTEIEFYGLEIKSN